MDQTNLGTISCRTAPVHARYTVRSPSKQAHQAPHHSLHVQAIQTASTNSWPTTAPALARHTVRTPCMQAHPGLPPCLPQAGRHRTHCGASPVSATVVCVLPRTYPLHQRKQHCCGRCSWAAGRYAQVPPSFASCKCQPRWPGTNSYPQR